MKTNPFIIAAYAVLCVVCGGVACKMNADKQYTPLSYDALQVADEARIIYRKSSGDKAYVYKTSQHAAEEPYSAMIYDSNMDNPVARQTTPSNNPPVVRIMAPENNSFFEWNAQVDYAIKISDAEDGESDNLDIASNEVFLEVVYLPDAAMAIDYAKKNKTDFDSPGFKLLRVADCFNCHAVKTRLQGPSFLEITGRYPHTQASIKMLAKRVIQGSSGVWGIPAMTDHPDLTEEQAGQIVQWIFENAGDPDRSYYSGTRGTFPAKVRQENDAKGIYRLTAVYTDHGLQGQTHTSKSGLHTIMLRSK